MPKPVMQSVYSSHVDRIGHDPETNELHVQWQGGKTSIYSGVPAGLAEDVRNSWSVGNAVKDQIIDKFSHRYEG